MFPGRAPKTSRPRNWSDSNYTTERSRLFHMNKKLYVGNLPLFGGDGRQVVSVRILSDRATGRSRGFGFVEMASADDAQKAIEALNGKDFMGRPLTVNEAREQAPRTGGGGFGGGGFGGGGRGGFGGGGGGGGRGGFGGGGGRGGRGGRGGFDRGDRGDRY